MRLIDADALKNDNWNVFEDEYGLPVAYVLVEDIRNAPTVDAVEVIRCKDCKHYHEFRTKRNKQIMRFCMRMAKNDMEYHVKPDDYCSYGERSCLCRT